MTAAHRWIVVALGLTMLIGVPLGLRAVPAGDSDVSAATLYARVVDSASVGYSGYAESLGTLQLPVTDNFTDVGELFGERTRLRVWWRGSDDWRVDKVFTTGEVDYIRDQSGTTIWDYEKAEATRTRNPDVRLPQPGDLLPPNLARLLLADAAPDELSRLPAEQVAGISAPGLRLTPSSDLSTIAAVDVWADEKSGLPLKIEVYAKGAREPAISSVFSAVTIAIPSAERTSFLVPPGADFRRDDVLDIADAANTFGHAWAPTTVIGLRADPSRELRAVGLYGRGVTRLVAIPLWDDAAEPLRRQLAVTPGVVAIPEGDTIAVGPLNVLLTEYLDGSGWLLSGTVTRDALAMAAHEVRLGVRSR